MVSAANQFSLLNFVLPINQFRQVYCSQRISFCCRIYRISNESISLLNCGVNGELVSLSNCGVSNESIFAVKLWCQHLISFRYWILCCQLISFHYRIMCSSELVCWWVCVTNEPVLLMILYSSESVRWQIYGTNELVLLMKFCDRLHIRIGSMIKMIALYDCNL